ncbi:MAG TPA: hypothetical protein VGD78_10630 [Chthoniobacterales bacterium]
MEERKESRLVSRDYLDRQPSKLGTAFERALRGRAFHLWGATLTTVVVTVGLTLSGVFSL